MSAPPFARSWEWRWPLGIWAVVVLAVSDRGALARGRQSRLVGAHCWWGPGGVVGVGPRRWLRPRGWGGRPALTRFKVPAVAPAGSVAVSSLSHWVERSRMRPTHVQATRRDRPGLPRLGPVGRGRRRPVGSCSSWGLRRPGGAGSPHGSPGRAGHRQACSRVRGVGPGGGQAPRSTERVMESRRMGDRGRAMPGDRRGTRRRRPGPDSPPGCWSGRRPTPYGAPALVVPWAVLLVWAWASTASAGHRGRGGCPGAVAAPGPRRLDWGWVQGRPGAAHRAGVASGPAHPGTKRWRTSRS